jgi:hypothetical protein
MRLNRGAKTPKGDQPCVRHAIDWQGQRRYAAPCNDHRAARPEFRNAALNRHMLRLAKQTRVAAQVKTHRVPLFFANTHDPSLLAPLTLTN